MEKLFDLLKQHCRKRYGFKDNDDLEIDTDSVSFHLYFKGERLFPIRVETVICKEFGFIKWLVDNEKIDCGTRNPLFITELVGEQEKQMPYSFYKEMLIRLALSDTPIEDLISYLK